MMSLKTNPPKVKRLQSFWLYALLALVCALTFYPMFRNGFVWDDPHFIAGNSDIRGLWPPARFFQPHGSAAETLTFDRAVMVFSLALDYSIWKLNPFGYHLTNFLLHLLCVFGVAFLTQRLSRSKGAGFVSGALFALHPGHAEGVIAFAGRSDLLVTLFVLLGLLTYIRHRETEAWSRAVWYLSSLLSFLLACFSKESGLALLGILVVYDFIGSDESEIPNLKSRIARLVPFFLAGLLYWVHRAKVIRGQFAGSAWWGGSPYKNCLMALEVYARYLRLLFIPLSLSPLHIVPVPAGFWDVRVVWGLVLLLGSLACAVWLLRRHPWAGLMASWFLIGLVPVANIIPVPGAQILNEHRLYLPSVGACVLGGWGAWVVYRGRKRWLRQVWAGFVVLILLLFGVRTFLWSYPWRSEESIARTMVATAPQISLGHNNLGNALSQQGNLEEAEKEYREAIRLNPEYADAHINLGDALSAQGDLDQAIAEYREALRLNPDFAEAHNDLGIALIKQRKPDEAIAEFHAALSLDPDNAEAHYNLGNVLSEQGNPGQAIAEYREVIRLNPDFAMAHNYLGEAFWEQGEPAEAEKEFREAIRLNPDYAEAQNNLGMALYKQGNLAGAVAAYQEAVRLNAGFARAHYNLGSVLGQEGKYAEAEKALRQAIDLDPNYVAALENLAAYLDLQGRRGEAREFWLRAEKLESRPQWVERIEKRLAEHD